MTAKPAQRADGAASYLVAMSDAEAFAWTRRKNGDVVVTHHGRVATVLRGQRAEAFLADIRGGDDQVVMARLTGNYKRGNEREARRHPRNQA